MINKIVYIGGEKGGSSKTTTSHLLAHGLAGLGVQATVATTDEHEVVLTDEGRSYSTVETKTGDDILGLINYFREGAGEEHEVLVIDGGASQATLDDAMHEEGLADLIVLPFMDSHIDQRRVAKDAERMGSALLLPSRWPTAPATIHAANARMHESLGQFGDRILSPVPASRAIDELFQDSEDVDVKASVDRIAHWLAMDVLKRLDMDLKAIWTDLLGMPNEFQAGKAPEIAKAISKIAGGGHKFAFASLVILEASSQSGHGEALKAELGFDVYSKEGFGWFIRNGRDRIIKLIDQENDTNANMLKLTNYLQTRHANAKDRQEIEDAILDLLEAI